jgi:hypothetical protein
MDGSLKAFLERHSLWTELRDALEVAEQLLEICRAARGLAGSWMLLPQWQNRLWVWWHLRVVEQRAKNAIGPLLSAVEVACAELPPVSAGHFSEQTAFAMALAVAEVTDCMLRMASLDLVDEVLSRRDIHRPNWWKPSESFSEHARYRFYSHGRIDLGEFSAIVARLRKESILLSKQMPLLQKPKRRGRPPDTDPKADARVSAVWKNGNGCFRTHAELADCLKMPVLQVKRALDRERKRKSNGTTAN